MSELEKLNQYIANLSPEDKAKHLAKTKDNPQAIFDLIKKGDTVAIALAVENGFDVSIQNEKKQTPLHVAAEHDTQLIADVLTQEANDAPWQRDNQGKLPLDIARENGHHELGNKLEQITYPEQFLELNPDNERIAEYVRQSSSKAKDTEPVNFIVMKDKQIDRKR